MRRLRIRAAGSSGDPLIAVLALVSMLIPMLLYCAVFVRFRTLEVRAPRTIIERSAPPEQPLDLTVMITDQGFYFRVDPARRLPWMAQAVGAAGPDIPRTEAGLDFELLTDRLREIKRDNARETKIILGAEDHVPFDDLIQAMDHARGDDAEPLFPDVTLTRGVV
jgi:biopolymer transport protein ExbD